MKSPKPIFICGYPKSGTTLFTALLDGHSQIVVFPEETFYTNKIHQHPEFTVNDGVKWLLSESDIQKMELGFAEGIYGNIDYSDFNYTSFQDLFLEKLKTCDNVHGKVSRGDVLKHMVAAYAEETKQTGKNYWAEKSPGNEMYLDKLLGWYSCLRAIYIVRDPRDVYTSYNRKKN